MSYDSNMTHTPYVYRLTDKTNGKRYIGSRYGKGCAPDDLGVTYFTSSRTVSKLFRENPERFEKQIIVTGTIEFVIKVEFDLIEMYDAVMSDEFYNRTNGKGIHPEDVRSGALKEHAKRSPEMYSNIVKQMHAKTTPQQRSKLAIDNYSAMTPEQARAKMEHMRSFNVWEATDKRKQSWERMKASGVFADMGSAGGKVGGVKACVITNSQRWKCAECGMVSLPGPLGKHQSRSGHSGKEKIS